MPLRKLTKKTIGGILIGLQLINMEASVKNHTDMLIFHTAICAGASQIATDGRREPDVLVATPSLRSGMEISVKNRIDMPIFHTVICDEHK